MSIRFLNSLTGKIEPLTTRIPSVVSWYACGPTVYDEPHLGHARTYVTQDIIRRIMEGYGGLRVRLQMGITDIDDKIISRASQENVKWEDISSRYTKEFMEMLTLLNIKYPTQLSFVSASIEEIGKFVEKLMADGYAYRAPSGSIYFSVKAFQDAGFKYWRFQGQTLKPFKVLDKRDSRDFALWKAQKPPLEPVFDILGVPGRPGWHVECSAMIHSGIGEIDLHSGGKDLKFPHHENEVAQSEAFANEPGRSWCPHFIHIGHVKISGTKMSKSLKNYVSVKDFLQNESADLLRMICLLKPYAEDFDFNDNSLEFARNTLRQVKSGLANLEKRCLGRAVGAVAQQGNATEWYSVKEEMLGHLLDNFSTSRAMALILRWLANLPKHDPLSLLQSLEDIRSFLQTMGLKRLDKSEDALMRQVAELRTSLRAMALAGPVSSESILQICDQIRSSLGGAGVHVNDDPIGKISRESTQ